MKIVERFRVVHSVILHDECVHKEKLRRTTRSRDLNNRKYSWFAFLHDCWITTESKRVYKLNNVVYVIYIMNE